jgi:hypothetical protein
LLAPSAGAAGPPLGGELQINTYTTSFQRDPDVASDIDGNFVVVWQSYLQDGSSGGIFGQRFDAAGAALGSEFQINTYTPGAQYRPVVTSTPGGDFVVAWDSQDQDGSGRGIFARRFDANGSPRAEEFQVNTYTSLDQYQPSVTSNEAGDFVVVWTSMYQDGSGRGLFAQRFDPEGNRSGGELQVPTDPQGWEVEAAASAAPDGSLVVTWRETESFVHGEIFGQRFDPAGERIGGEFRINTYSKNRQSDPAVDTSADGDFVVAWTSFGQDGSFDGVFGQRYEKSGNRAGSELRVNTSTERFQNQAAVASDSEQGFVVVWTSDQSGAVSDVFEQEFDAAGDPRGSELRVNTFTTGNQLEPRIAMDGAGNYVVVWSSFGQDGDHWGVFGQRFAKSALTLSILGGCPGEVVAQVTNASPRSEVGLVIAANNSGFVKGGSLCAGTVLEIGEPFVLPPTWVLTDQNGAGSANLLLSGGSCWVQALALADCSTSNAVQVP